MEDMLGQEPRLWLQQGRLASPGTRSGAALATVVVEGADGNGDASDESRSKPVPGNGAGRGRCGGRRAAPGSRDQGSGFHRRGPQLVGLPAGLHCRGAWPGYCFADKVFESAPESRGGGHLLRRHKLLLWRRRDCFFTQSRCFQHASSSVGNLVQ